MARCIQLRHLNEFYNITRVIHKNWNLHFSTGHPLILFILVIKSYLQIWTKKRFRGCYQAMNFCKQIQWNLWVIFCTTQKSHVNFHWLCQKFVLPHIYLILPVVIQFKQYNTHQVWPFTHWPSLIQNILMDILEHFRKFL